MIKYTTEYNKKDFEYNTNLLINNDIQNCIDKITPQDMYLKSENMNRSFDAIEEGLNHLYEKTRIIQDLFDYARYYIEQNIYDISKQCRSVINSIETNRDKIKGYEYNTIPVTLLDSPELHYDRNDTSLDSCDYENDKLIPSGRVEEKIQIESIEKIKGFIPYRNNIDDLTNEKQYRSFYLMDGPGSNGLKETLLITLKEVSYANSLRIKTSNCLIESVSYIDENDNKIMIDKFNGYIAAKVKIKKILLTICCNSYKQKSYAIDIKRFEDNNFWDKVKEEQYREAAGLESVYDLDELSGMEKNREDYNDFVKKVQQWEDGYIQYKIDHNEWEKRKAFFESLKDTVIKGEDAWDDIEVTSNNTKVNTTDIFKDGTLQNNTVRLARKDPKTGKITYKDLTNMSEKEINNTLANDPNTFLVNGNAQAEEPSSLQFGSNVVSNLYALNSLILKGIYPLLKQVLIVEQKEYEKYFSMISLKAQRILSMNYYKEEDPEKLNIFIKETDGIGIAIKDAPCLKEFNLKHAVVLSSDKVLDVINKANEISGD